MTVKHCVTCGRPTTLVGCNADLKPFPCCSMYCLNNQPNDDCDRCKSPASHTEPTEGGAVASLLARLCHDCRASVTA